MATFIGAITRPAPAAATGATYLGFAHDAQRKEASIRIRLSTGEEKVVPISGAQLAQFFAVQIGGVSLKQVMRRAFGAAIDAYFGSVTTPGGDVEDNV